MNYQSLFKSASDSVVEFVNGTFKTFVGTLKHVSIESIGWAALLLMHAVTVPNLLGLMTGMTDATPPIDMVLILWAGLALFLAKAIIQRDIIPIIIIGAGFVGQAFLMALVFFK